jgi:26S proteasome regulatory subunit N5
MASTTRIAKTITALCYDARDYDLLNSSILVLSKKHGQLKAVVKALVEQTQEWLDEIKTRKGIPTWLLFVETLRTVTEGKVGLSALDVLS